MWWKWTVKSRESSRKMIITNRAEARLSISSRVAYRLEIACSWRLKMGTRAVMTRSWWSYSESSRVNPRFSWPLAAFTSHHHEERPADGLESVHHISTICPCCKLSPWFIGIGRRMVPFQLCWAQQEPPESCRRRKLALAVQLHLSVSWILIISHT